MKIKLETINLELSPEDAKRLYDELCSVFKTEKIEYVPFQPYIPQYPWIKHWTIYSGDKTIIGDSAQ